MKSQLTPTALKSYVAAPAAVQKTFDKHTKLLVDNFRHPSLQAKKYDERESVWQARVNLHWRFYFLIEGDTYLITNITPHPK